MTCIFAFPSQIETGSQIHLLSSVHLQCQASTFHSLHWNCCKLSVLFLYLAISVMSDCVLQLQCLVQLCVLVTPQSWCDDVTHMAGKAHHPHSTPAICSATYVTMLLKSTSLKLVRHLKAAQHTIYSSVCGVTSDDRSSRESDSPTPPPPPQIDSPPSPPLLPAGASCCRDLRNEKPFMEWGRGRRVTGDQGMGRLEEPPIPHKTS